MRATTPLWFVSSIAAAFVIGHMTATPVQRVSAMPQAPITREVQNPIPNPAPPGFTHIMCYQAAFSLPLPATTVFLQDQFNTTGFTTTLQNPLLFCTPTKKKLLGRHPLRNAPNGHWVAYPITQAPPVNTVHPYINQLEKNQVTFNNIPPVLLLVPTQKM